MTVTELPPWQGLNIGALSRLFSERTNSYKFLMFRALLDILKAYRFDVAEPIPFQKLAVEILMNAWYPHCFFKLSFGRQDRLAQWLDDYPLQLLTGLGKVDTQAIRSTLEHNLKDQAIHHMLRYVRLRLLSAFFAEDLAGLSDSRKNKTILELSQREFELRKPLYRVEQTAIVVHPHWADYLQTHYAIVSAWASWEWLRYMQRCNPNTPNLSSKLSPPLERHNLAQQKAFWLALMETTPIHCIYSGQPLTEAMSIDHFLPWTFTAHDELWNLAPTIAAINSSKGDRVPDTIYLDRFISLHGSALPLLSKPRFARFADEYVAALHVPELGQVGDGLRRILPPLMSLAAGQGFAGGWRWQ
ncbi:MAG TPA: HNH endonuclease domain-containing protein [Candidatus Xenobia bacterium]